MKRSKLQTRRDPVISLINIVFLILIFFMIAGTLASPPDPSVRFVQTQDLECCVPPDAVSIDKTGQLRREALRSAWRVFSTARRQIRLPYAFFPIANCQQCNSSSW